MQNLLALSLLSDMTSAVGTSKVAVCVGGLMPRADNRAGGDAAAELQDADAFSL